MKNLTVLLNSNLIRIRNYASEIIQRIVAGENIIIKPPSYNNHTGKENNQNNNEPKTIAVADIGNYKIVVVIARLNAAKKIEIIGCGEEKTEGVTKGMILNIFKVSQRLKIALDKAAEQADFIPKSISVSISCTVKTYQHKEVLIRNHHSEIIKDDIKKLKLAIHQSGMYANEEILYTEPLHFTVDGEFQILNPVGMNGKTVEGIFKVLTCSAICIKNLKRCCDLIGISLANTFPSIIASAESILHQEEMSGGVAIVDIGAEKASIAIYKGNNLVHIDNIPLGGNHITNDICKYAGLFFRSAEEIKIKYGSATYLNLNEDETIKAKLFKHHMKTMFKKDISYVIHCRLVEILEFIDFAISSHIDKKQLIYGIIFTGGTSNTSSFRKLLKPIFKIDCFTYLENNSMFTIINPNNIYLLNNPIYTAVLGVLKLDFKK
jgi:cell division protein FtsA